MASEATTGSVLPVPPPGSGSEGIPGDQLPQGKLTTFVFQACGVLRRETCGHEHPSVAHAAACGRRLGLYQVRAVGSVGISRAARFLDFMAVYRAETGTT